MSEREILTRFGEGPPAAQGYTSAITELTTYYDISTTPLTLYVFLQGAWQQVGAGGAGSQVGIDYYELTDIQHLQASAIADNSFLDGSITYQAN